jgi:hypothetical protein
MSSTRSAAASMGGSPSSVTATKRDDTARLSRAIEIVCDLLVDADQALDRFKVPDPERQEPIAIIESTKEAIVVSPFQEGLATATAGAERP